jgi:hypothetical protein
MRMGAQQRWRWQPDDGSLAGWVQGGFEVWRGGRGVVEFCVGWVAGVGWLWRCVLCGCVAA